ncbi:MAG: patatin-like phospholipase family protein, partial [Methanococcaceae archaeon]
MSKYRILAIDGGGIRGIVSAVILDRLNRETNLVNSFDLAAGTSTGGLIALALAHGVDINAIKNIYLDKGKFIFNDTWYDDLKDLLGLTGADYNSENLCSVLKSVFGDTRMKDLKHHVLVTAFDLDNNSPDNDRRTWQPVNITNFPFTKINN